MKKTAKQNKKENWLNKHYNWINPNNIHIRNTSGYDEIFKAEKVKVIRPDFHFDDSVAATTELLKRSDTNVIYIPRLLEQGVFKDFGRVVEIVNFNTIARMITEQ